MNDAARTQWEGFLLLLLAAAGYSFLPILAKWAYATGLEPVDLLTWRFILATPLIWLFLWRRGFATQRSTLPRRSLVAAGALFGIVAGTAFFALDRIPSSTYTVLLYSYPATVALLAHLLGEKLSARGWGALGLTLLGVLLIVPNPWSGLAGADMVGIALALLNATLYSVYILISSRLLKGQSALTEASAWSISGSLLLFGAVALVRGLVWPVGAAAWASVVGLAVLSTSLPIAAFYAGLQRVGAPRAAILSTIEPLLTLLLAALLLHERMTLPQWLGGMLILSSVLLLQWPALRQRRRRAAAQG